MAMAEERAEARTDRRRAVALRYHSSEDTSPRVLAKGQGEIAERIIAVAALHGVPLHEDRDLVQLLGVLDLDVEVPPTLYRALAEVLAHIYRANAQLREEQGQRTLPAALPQPPPRPAR
jgi:flagellar biosynthesis protein